MHEQVHANENLPKNENNLSGSEDYSPGKIQVIAEQMRSYALRHPFPQPIEGSAEEAADKSKFSHSFPAGQTFSVLVMLTISRSATEADLPVWHASASLHSNSSGRAKSYGLWTKTEIKNAQVFLSNFLGDAGEIKSQTFSQTARALHCTRFVTREEARTILKDDKNGK